MRGTREDCEDLARGSLRAPHHGLVGGHHKAVAGLKCFIRSCDAGVQSSFDHVGGEFANAAALADGRGGSGWDFKDLRELVSFCGGDVQGRGPRAMFAATGGDVRSARDGDGVMLRLAEEVAEADSVDGANPLQRLERGNHAVGFELGEQGRRQVGLCSEARKRDVLRGAECAEFEADRVDGQGIAGLCRRQGHVSMLAGS